MAPPPSDTAFSSPNHSIRKPDEENYFYTNGSLVVQEFRYLAENESLQKEKQISIDPISLRELPVVATAPKGTGLLELPPSLLPGKPKFLSCSLPNSANSSPRFSTSLLKKKWKNESQNQPQIQSPASPLQNTVAEKQLNLPLEYYLRRSKSCGEGRTYCPSDDFDLWLHKPDFSDPFDNKKHCSSFSKADDHQMINKANHLNKNSNHNNMDLSSDDGFKCGACLFLPGFGKAKPVRAPRKEEVEVENVISRTVSLEKFECGSWASSAIGDVDSTNHYFDLPMELIRSGANDAHSPVSSAFLFDKDLKGVLKHGSSRSTAPAAARKSHESARHVRFSTASPTSNPASPASCITPRLRKAREDFNAFLEAQSA
ncbi:hypothetical protein TorRG33x02_203690 [Trema orientale]|uniref:Uncharacterized protein n=1 Tax=Trema orientale TaxID=63057 RepID=A0A2P5EE44_TREOI|nr:hypothetical protein TorRG33x02_203690 [Trema orientale]